MKNKLAGRPELLLLLFAFLVRAAFVLFLAKPYFGRENICVDGDTYPFAWAFQNLYETGTYTVNPGLEYGYFGRMPGYPFFMGLFYLLSGADWDKAFIFISWTQLFLDILSAWLFYLIALKLAKRKEVALTTLFLYTTYPFIIVWTPVVYAETAGVFCLLAAFFFYLYRERKGYFFFSGIFAAIGILIRPQAALLVPLILMAMLTEDGRRLKVLAGKCFFFLLPIIVIYGSWPLRNYVNHKKVIFTQDLRGFYNWNEDVLAFWAYVYAVKTEWEPQFTQIISNSAVVWPKESYRSREDSLKLEEAVYLAKNCGSGFSHKKGYWQASFDTPNCNNEIRKLFLELRDKQIKHNPWNYYVKLPVKNLKKALFKSSFYEAQRPSRKLASWLFYYRTFLLLMGMSFYLFIWSKEAYRQKELLIPLLYFILLYLLLCGGTKIPLRNIEIRYFLPADVLMLLPASLLIEKLFSGRLGRRLPKRG